MLREITLGQYYPVDSAVHRLDPRTKLFGTMVFIISLFMADSLWAYLLATVVLGLVIRASRVPFKFMVRGLRAVLVLLLISVSFNLFLTDGTVIVKFWIFKITHEGVRLAGFMALRLIYLVIGSSVMTLTTTPNQLTDGLEKSLGFLNKVGVPVHEVSMMMSIALRFIPILVEETDKIMKAQMARGADFESGNLIRKAKHGAAVGAAVYFRLPPGHGSGHGHGGALLPRRRGQDQDEAPALPDGGRDRLPAVCSVHWSHGGDTGGAVGQAAPGGGDGLWCMGRGWRGFGPGAVRSLIAAAHLIWKGLES